MLNEYKVTVRATIHGVLFANTRDFIDYRSARTARELKDIIDKEIRERFDFELEEGELSYTVDIVKI